MAGLTRDDLTTIATRTGWPVKAAWSDHNEGAMGTVYGVVMHHTGSAQNTASRSPTLAIVRQGRSDLQNALCTFYIDKDGVIYLVTEKVAWHAGQGAYRGITDGNGHLLGIEAESDGVTWTKATVDSYVALVAEICRYLGADPNVWAIRHATWATPPGRKTDFAGLSEADFKARVIARINGAPTPVEDDMSYSDWPKADRDRLLQEIRDYAISPMLGAIADSTWLYSINGTNARDRLQGTDAAANAAAAGVRSAADPALIAASVVGQLGAGLAREVVAEMGKQLGGAA